MAQTPEEYYGNDDNYGKYQYVPLTEVVNNIMLKSQFDDSIIKNIKRSLVLSFVKEGVRELTREVESTEQGFEITVPDSLVWPLPQDYVSYVGIGVVKRNGATGSFNVYELDIDYNMHTSIGYLQDNDANIIFDSDGQIIEADSSNAIAYPFKREVNNSHYLGNNPTKDTSKYSKHGLFSINERRGVIVFSSDLADKEVVIKYKSDGLEAELSNSVVYIHKHIKKPLEEYVIWQFLSIKKNISESRITSARNKFLSSRHKAVLARSDFDMMRILKHADSATKIF